MPENVIASNLQPPNLSSQQLSNDFRNMANLRLCLKTIALGAVATPPTHVLPCLFAQTFQMWRAFHSGVNCERPLKARRQRRAAMPSGPAEHQDFKHILGARVHGIANCSAQRPPVPSAVIILHETSNVCKVGAEVAPPRVLARVVEAQRIDGQYRSIWMVRSAFLPHIE